jgi:hypothetical protein
MTKGGVDIPFFWPLDARYGNWGPLRAADIGFELPDPRYSRAVRAELLWVWLPTVAVVGLVTAALIETAPRDAYRVRQSTQ